MKIIKFILKKKQICLKKSKILKKRKFIQFFSMPNLRKNKKKAIITNNNNNNYKFLKMNKKTQNRPASKYKYRKVLTKKTTLEKIYLVKVNQKKRLVKKIYLTNKQI